MTAQSDRECPAGARLPTAGQPWRVSVVIAAFSLQRWHALREAIASVQRQTEPAVETVLVIDHNADLLARAAAQFDGVTVIPNLRQRGASGARNSGVAACSGNLVAFLDDDAVAEPDWLERLTPHFARPEVIGVGGRLDPLWYQERPRWFPPEFDWAVGASYRGLPDVAGPVRNVWSANMMLRREVFDQIGGFREDFGKVGDVSRPEDTDLCLRAGAARRRGVWIYDPSAAARHRVPAQRTTLRYFMTRCFNEGLGKAALADFNGTGTATVTERRYAREVVPHGIMQGLRDTARGDLAGGARSLAAAAGLSVAAAGYLAGLLKRPATR